MESNTLVLYFSPITAEKVCAAARANALFIYSKLIAGGMDIKAAKDSVESLFSDGVSEGYKDSRN